MTSFDTDLTDDQWFAVAHLIPKAKFGGRPRKTDMRSVVNAILYVVKEGCRWRSLDPIPQFPPWETVYGYFRDWRHKAIWRKIHYHLYGRVRVEVEKRNPQPSAVVIDTQSIKTAKMAAIKSRGFDGGKRVKGRKRVLVTDTLGLLVDVSVVPANTHDTVAGQKVLTKVAKRYKKKGTIQTIFAVFLFSAQGKKILG
jgi:putative transposase